MGCSKSSPRRKFKGKEAFFEKQEKLQISNLIYHIKKETTGIQRTIQKVLHDPDNHCEVVTHLKPDILVSEVKWAQEVSL